MSDITVDLAQYTTDTTLNGPFNASDTVTLADDSSVLDSLTDAQIDSLATNNVDVISATDGVLSWTADQYAQLILGPVAIDPDTFAILADIGADIDALSATQIGEIAAKGVAVINPTDSVLTFSVAQFDALGAMSVDASATFTIADIGANLAGLSVGQIAALSSLGVDILDATDNALSLSVAQYQALGTVELTQANTVTLADTGADLNTLALSDFQNLHANGIDVIAPSDNAFALSLAEFNALDGVTLASGHTITLADAGAAIGGFSTGEIDTLATAGINAFDATDNALTLSLAQYNETVTDGIALTAANTVTLADAGATLAALTPTQLSALVNVDVINATDGALTVDVAQFNAIEGNSIALTAGNTVTLSDTAAALSGLTFSALAGENVDFLDATTAYSTLTVAELTALGTVAFTGASNVTLTDTGAAIAAVSNFSVFAAHGVDVLDASDNALTISEAQFQALGTTTLTGSDTVTISDTAANIVGGPNYGTLAAAGIDFLNATTAINVTVNDITNLGTVVFTAGSAVTLSDTGAHIAAVANFATFATHGVDTIDASNNTLTINATQFGELGSVTLTAADTVTISDSAAHLSGLTFSALAAANVDFLNSTNAYTNLTVQNVTDLGAVHFTAASNVTLTDSAADIQAVSDFTTFATHGVDTIKSSDNALSLTVAQFSGLGTTHLTGSDAVTLADSSANLDTYLDAAGTQTALSTNGVDTIHSTGGSISVDAAAFSAVHGAGAVFASLDVVTLADTGAAIAALDFTTLASTGIDNIDASDNTLGISLAQYLDIAGVVSLTAADTVTVSGSAAAVEALTTTQIGALVSNLVDVVAVTSGGDLDWSVAQWQQLGLGVSVTDTGYALVVDDSESNIEALSGAQLGGLATKGAQELASTGGSLNFTVSQAEGFLGTRLAIASGDTGTLVDTGTAIAAMTTTQIGELAAAGFDSINASNDAVSFTVAQFGALGTVTMTAADVVTLADTASNIETYLGGFVSAPALTTALSNDAIDLIHATGGSLSVTAAEAQGVYGASAAFLGSDTVTLSDTGAAIASAMGLLSSQLASIGVDVIDATDNALNLTTAEYLNIAGAVALTAGNTVTIADSEANIAALSATQIGALGTNLIDALSVTSGGDLDWSVAQWQALPGAVSISDAGHHLVVDDSETNIEALTGTQLGALATSGAQELNGGGTLNFTVSQAEGFLGTGLAATGTVTLADTGTAIAAMSATQIGELAAAGFDTIDASDNSLTLSTAQFSALGNVALTGADAVTIADTASNIDSFLDGSNASTELYDNGVNTIDATGGTLSVTASELNNVLGTGAVFLSGDTVTLADTGAHIASLNFSSLHSTNVDIIDATNNTLSISLGQYEDIAGVVALTAGNDVTVTGNLDNLSTTEIAGFATNNVDHLLDSDGFNEVIWNVAQWNALTTAVTIDNASHVPQFNVVFDSGTNLDALTTTQIANFVTEGAEVFEGNPSGQESVSWNVAQLQAMGAAVWASTTVTIYDTGTNLQAVSDYTLFSSHGITAISATDGSLTLTAAQFGGLGSVTVDINDTFTVADTATNIEAMGTAGYAAMAAAGVDFIHATGGSLTVTYDEFNAIASSSTVFTPADHVTLTGTQAELFDSRTPSFLQALGSTFHVDEISLTGAGHLTVAQWNALVSGSTALDSANDITLSDTGADLSGETAADVAAMAGQIDHWESNDGNTVVASKAVLDALATASIDFTPNNYVVLFSDTETTVEGLTATQLEGYITQGVTAFRASDTSTLNLDVSQVNAVVGNGAYFVPANTVTLVDTAGAIGGLSAVQYGELVTGFVDTITATGGTLQMSVADFEAIKTALHSGALTLTNAAQLADAGTTISALTTTELGQLSGDNITSISATGSVDFTQAQVTALGGVSVSTSGAFILADSEANIEGLSTATIDSDAAAGVSEIHSTGVSSTLNFTVAQAQHILSDGISIENTTVTVTDTGADISGLSFAQLNGMSTAGFTGLVDTSGTITWSLSQLNHLTVPLTLNGNGLTLSDTEATLEAQNATEWAYIASLATSITASNTSTLNLNYGQISKLFGSGATFATANTVTLTDSSTVLDALTTTQIGDLSAVHVDAINATDDTLTWSVAQFDALNGVTLTGADHVTLSDSSTNLLTLNFGSLAAAGVDQIDATDNALTLSVSQFNALGSVALTAGDTVTISDVAANITTLNFANLAAANIDVLDVTNGFSLSVARYESMGAVKFAAADSITLSDAGAAIAGMSAAQFAALAGNGIDKINATDNALSLTVAQYTALGAVSLVNSDTITLADSGSAIAALSATQFGQLAANGIDKIDATNNVLSLTVAQYNALGAVQLTQADTVTLDDTGANIALLNPTQIAALAAAGIDKIDASNNVLSISVAQYEALGAVTLTGSNTVTLLDTGADLEAFLNSLSNSQIAALAGSGIDILNASDGVLTLTASQFQNLGTVSLKSSNTVTLQDTVADISTLTAGQFNALAAKGIDILDATDASANNPLDLTAAKLTGLGALMVTANGFVTLKDTEANIEAQTGAQLTAEIAKGVSIITANDNVLNLNVSQISALLGTSAVFASTNTVTLTDTAAHIQALTATQIGELAGVGVDKIDATDNTLTLNIAQYEALGSVQLSASDTNTLADAYIPGLVDLSTTVIASLGGEHISHIHGTFMFEWSVAQFSALATNITIDTAYGPVRILDTAANIESLTPTQIATFHTEGLAQLQIATHGGGSELDFSVAQTNAITTAGLSFSTDNGTTANPIITDTGTAIAAMTTTQIAAAASDGFTGINATDGALTLSLAQFNALGGIALTAANTVTVADTEANIEALTNTQFTAMVSNHVDIIHSTNGILNVSAAQVGALLATGTHFAAGDTVTLVDTGLNISSFYSGQIGELAAAGIDSIDASDNAIKFNLAQYFALGTVTLTQADTVTIQNDNVAISGMTVAEIQGLAASGVDVLESYNANFSFSAAQADAFVNQTGGGHVSLSAGDTFYVNDTAANVGALSIADITAFGALGAGGVDLIASGTLTINLAYYNAAVSAHVAIDGGDSVTLADTNANLRALTTAQIAALAGNGIDVIHATGGSLILSIAQLNALGAVALTQTDTVTLSDSAAKIQALSASQITAYITQGVDIIHSGTNVLSLTEAQIAAILPTSAILTASDTDTLADTGAHIALLTATQFGQLAAKGIDKIDASDNMLSLSVAQYSALGAVTLTAADTVTLADTAAHLSALTTGQLSALGAGGIDVIHSTSNAFSFTVAQANAFDSQTSGTVGIAATDTLTISDTGAHIGAMTATQLGAIASVGAGHVVLDASDNLLSLSVAQETVISADGIGLTAANTVTLADNGAALAAYLTPTVIASLSNIDAINATDDAIGLSKAQLDALATAAVALTGADTVTLTDTAATIDGLTAAQFTAYATQGVDVFHSTSGALTISESQGAAVLDSAAIFDSNATVTISDTAAHLQLLTPTEIGQLSAKNIHALAISDAGTLTLSVSTYQAFPAGVTINPGTGHVALSDTGLDIATLTATQLAALDGNLDVTHLDATDNAIALSEAQTAALIGQAGTLTLDATDTFTVSDSGTDIALLTAANLTALGGMGAGHVVLDASDNVLTITTAQYNAIIGSGIALTAADTVTLADTGTNLASLNSTQLAALSANNVDAIHATNGAVTFSVAQLNALQTANIALTPADTVTLSDTQTNIQALTGSQLAGYATQGVDVISSTSGTLNLSEAQISSFLATPATFDAANTVTLLDTGVDIAALTAAQFSLLASHGVDVIDASDNALSLTAAQYADLGVTELTQANTVTLSDTGAHIAALSTAQFAQMAAAGIDTIDASNNALLLTVAQYEALGSVTLTQSDTDVLFDIGANLGALTATQIGNLAAAGIDRIDATDNVLTLSVAQLNALGTVTLTGSDTVTLADLGATLDALTPTQIHALAGEGIDKIDATDNVLSLSVAQYQALGHVALTQSDNVTLSDLGADISALSASKIGALAGAGIDTINATDNAITFSLAQYSALGAVHLSLDDTITINGTSGTDLIQGRGENDVINGGAGDDVLFGGDGNDTLDGGLGNDTLNGGGGFDTASYADATSGVTVNLANGTATGGAGSDLLTSIEGITGSNYADVLVGSSGNNTINGGAGNDIITGGQGTDTLTGGPGADHFVYTAATDSQVGLGVDTITDFSHAQGDQIDVSAMGNFTFVTHYTDHADQLEVVSTGVNTYQVRADLNGDGVTDFTIIVHSTTALVASDFIL